MATLLYQHVEADYIGQTAPYADVAPDSDHANSVAWIHEFEIAIGCEPDLFCPDRKRHPRRSSSLHKRSSCPTFGLGTRNQLLPTRRVILAAVDNERNAANLVVSLQAEGVWSGASARVDSTMAVDSREAAA